MKGKNAKPKGLKQTAMVAGCHDSGLICFWLKAGYFGSNIQVSVLEEIRQIMCSSGKEAEWKKLFSDLLVEHRKKRLLLKLIDEQYR